MAIQVKAKVNFYDDLVGNRTANEVFEVADKATYENLADKGYVEKVASSREAAAAQNQNVTNVEAMNPFAKNNMSQEQVGQAQAEANRQAATAAQAMHEAQLRQDQAEAQQAQQAASTAQSQSQMNQADQAAVKAQETGSAQSTATTHSAEAQAKAATKNQK